MIGLCNTSFSLCLGTRLAAMASSQKIVTFCICVLIASFGVLVEGGKGMMGMFGGGGHHGGGYEGLGVLLAAGLLAKLLRGGGSGHGGYGHARAAYAAPRMYHAPHVYAAHEMYSMPRAYGMELGHGF